jgi:hypothetical protein
MFDHASIPPTTALSRSVGRLRPAFKRGVAVVLAASMACSAWAQAVPSAVPGTAPTLVPTEAFVVPAGAANPSEAAAVRERLLSTLDRQEVITALVRLGVDLQQARDRVVALTDAEAQRLAAQVDRLPAGSSEIITTVMFVFVLLLITDILGLTKVFPFTRAVR